MGKDKQVAVKERDVHSPYYPIVLLSLCVLLLGAAISGIVVSNHVIKRLDVLESEVSDSW